MHRCVQKFNLRAVSCACKDVLALMIIVGMQQRRQGRAANVQPSVAPSTASSITQGVYDKHRLLYPLRRRRAQRPAPAMAPRAQPSRVPGRLAWVFGIALLYCDRAAPLLLSPQTGWHFGAAARWVWLTFAAAGQAGRTQRCGCCTDAAGCAASHIALQGSPESASRNTVEAPLVPHPSRCTRARVVATRDGVLMDRCFMQAPPRGCC